VGAPCLGQHLVGHALTTANKARPSREDPGLWIDREVTPDSDLPFRDLSCPRKNGVAPASGRLPRGANSVAVHGISLRGNIGRQYVFLSYMTLSTCVPRN
jgi:hypothetical protein